MIEELKGKVQEARAEVRKSGQSWPLRAEHSSHIKGRQSF